MPMSNNARKLELAEARKLMSQEKAAELDRKAKSAIQWPGLYNTRLIAEAVNNRRQYIDLESDEGIIKQFSIKYDNRISAVYLKPTDGSFVPCGWFSYADLKHAIEAIEA